MAKKEVPTLQVHEQSGPALSPPIAVRAAPKLEPKQDKTKLYAKTVQLGLGVDLLASRLSLNSSRGATLEVTPLGVKAYSGKNTRVVLIPWANIRGVELYPED